MRSPGEKNKSVASGGCVFDSSVRRLRMRKSNDWEGWNKNSRQFVLIIMMTLMQPQPPHLFVMATLELISQDIEA